MLIDGLWIIVIFLSVIWTLFLMAPIHCRGSIVSKFISQNLFRRNKHFSILDGLRVSQLSFWVNNFFNRHSLHWEMRWEMRCFAEKGSATNSFQVRPRLFCWLDMTSPSNAPCSLLISWRQVELNPTIKWCIVSFRDARTCFCCTCEEAYLLQAIGPQKRPAKQSHNTFFQDIKCIYCAFYLFISFFGKSAKL